MPDNDNVNVNVNEMQTKAAPFSKWTL